jgi:hypothetical protein
MDKSYKNKGDKHPVQNPWDENIPKIRTHSIN